MPARRKVLGAVLALLLVTAVAVVGWRWWSGRDTTDLQRAMALAPADGQRFSFTDWAGVRAELGSEVDADSFDDEVNALLDEAFDADLASTSALVESAETLQSRYGFSPASLEWELFSQGEAGAVAILEVADGGVADVAERLTELGYDEPADETGVWTGGDTLLAQIGGVTPVLAHVALDEDRGLVLASDNVDYLRGLVEEDDTGLSGLDDDGVDAAVDAAGEPVTAAVYTGDHVCRALAMAQADPADAAEGERLVDEAGGVHPLTGFVMGTQPGGDVRVAMALEDEDRARADADARATLAAGPAPGQGGDFADRFELGRVAAEGAVVTMELEPTPGSYVLSDLSTGPVLFATC
ncbi:hypothetical protein QWY28_16095 [Nocardioides sp. SOB77]|uniref:DUF3352 domain-containing protein n=1 Tax=Nocardioides oceani TaxID=3058369 RepID=A0ABT8FJB5_9ACTN|nr:hypothetical protein [Nocardioides oceani]MDN4174482.1 hypothetical protein [Nocardioides oceani]